MDRAAERGFDDAVIGRTTISQAVAASAERHAHRDAQAYKGAVYDRSLVPAGIAAAPAGEYTNIDYREFHEIIRTLAAGFRTLGVRPDDRIGIFAQTRLEWAHTDLAVLAAGGVVTTVYPGSSPRQVRYLLSDAGASGVVVENSALLDRVLAVEADLDLDFIVTLDRLPAEQSSDIDRVFTLGDVYQRGRDHNDAAYERWLEARDPGDLASIIYTSGTTGRPKGVRLTHWNFKANLDQCRRRYGPRPDTDGPVLDETTRVVSFLPLAHSFERLAGHFLLFASGATVAYAESPDTLRDDFLAIRPTSGTSVPRVYERIYATIQDEAASSPFRERIFDWATRIGRRYARTDNPGPLLTAKHRIADTLVFSSIRDALGGEIEFLVSGGGSLPGDLCALFHGMELPILEGYGLTETAPVISGNPPDAPVIGTIGPPLVNVETRLDETITINGIDPPESDWGELLVRGPNVFDGYWNRPDQTDAVFDDGWFRTGDIVAQRDDGYLVFLERRKELLVLSTGKNVAPTPIEDALTSTALIEQAMVIGDDRKFTAALIVPNLDRIRTWADRVGVDVPTDPAAVCTTQRVRERIAEDIDRVNQDLEDHETIKRFRLIPEEFTEENGLLTPTLKKKRRSIRDRYAAKIDDLYTS